MTRPVTGELRNAATEQSSAGSGVAARVLFFTVASHSLSHGILSAIRSLGRLGVEIYATAEDRYVPYAFSRYLKKLFVREAGHPLTEGAAVEDLLRIGRQIGGPIVLLPADDEAAVVAAEHRETLSDHYLLPHCPQGLTRQLASKWDLFRLCTTYQVPTAQTVLARTVDDLLICAEECSFPLIVKNSEPWRRLQTPPVGSTTLVKSKEELIALALTCRNDPYVVLQEYIPTDRAEDWIVEAYCGSQGRLVLTGRKIRSWPPHRGFTTYAIAEENPRLHAAAIRLFDAIDYRGIAATDWRFDASDGSYKLLDFNPRFGANFRLFQTEEEVDVVRAAYYDLCVDRRHEVGKESRQQIGRKFMVEHLDVVSRLFGGRGAPIMPDALAGRTELAWFAKDDLLPIPVMAGRFGIRAASKAWRGLRRGSMA